MSNSISNRKIVITKSAKGTKSLGKKIAQKIISQGPGKVAFILALHGDLGSGKTTFIQGLAKGLGVKERIISPTFVIIKKFKVQSLRPELRPRVSKFKVFYHIDCYRLQKPEEILELCWREIIANPQNIVAIEWPEKIKKFLPKHFFQLHFTFLDQNKRRITVNNRP